MKKRAVALVFTTNLLAGGAAFAEAPQAPGSAKVPRTPSPDPWALGSVRTVAVAAQLGVYHRLDAPPAFTAVDTNALGGGLDVQAFVARRFAVTFAWERVGLGSERTGITEFGSASIARRADGVWLGMRLAPWASEYVSTTVAVAVGAAWQHASADGIVWPALQPSLGTPIACGGSGSPAPAMRVDVGLEAPLGNGLAVFGSGGFGVFAFGDGALGECVLGAGSTQLLAGRLGVSYTFDIGGGGE